MVHMQPSPTHRETLAKGEEGSQKKKRESIGSPLIPFLDAVIADSTATLAQVITPLTQVVRLGSVPYSLDLDSIH